MTRQTRLVVILVVLAVAGVSGLMLVANQYKKAHAEASARAIRLVDGYLAARRAAKAVVDVSGPRMGESPDAVSAYRTERGNALTAHGMTYEDYVAVRTAWRAFAAGAPVSDPSLRAALAARAKGLRSVDLGPIEALDDTIK